MFETYFNTHSHTHFSNIRLLDCINRPKDLIDKAIELGLAGIAITDHECLSSHLEVNQYAQKIKETHPHFKVALGNEIYLVDERDGGIKYYHFILIAKDAYGHKGLRELSSIAWYNSYVDRGMERVPVLKRELAEVMKKYKGHIIATSACMGGELSTAAYQMSLAQNVGDNANASVFYQQICDFMEFCVNVFGDDFYIECAPSTAEDQRITNAKLYRIAQSYNVPMVVGTDAHYLTKEDRFVHKSYLNSKGGEREIDAFYEFTYVMTPAECHELLMKSFNDSDIVDSIFGATIALKTKIQDYSLERKQMIPKVQVKDYPRCSAWEWDMFPTLRDLLASEDIQERYWVNECILRLAELGLDGEPEYAKRLEIEADIIRDIGGKLDDCLFAYFNTFKHYIDLFWDCGSIVGPGRGSATGFLSNYLLGITQLDPVRWNLPYWRFLNKERAELPDIDIDLAPSKRPGIFKAIREERGEFGLIQVATFGTEGTKSAILTACRGYRSSEYPDGIDVDQAQYMSSLIPQERGFLWSISDVINGNEENPSIVNSPEDLIYVIYTSGSTGNPKGAMLTHGNWFTAIHNACDVLTYKENDTFLCIYPMAHVGIMWAIAALRAASYYILIEEFNLDEYLELCESEKVTVLTGMPPVIHSLTTMDKTKELKTVREIISGGGPLHKKIWKEFHKTYQIKLCKFFD